MALSDNATITMPVAPAYQAGGYGSSMWGGDLSSWFTLFLIFGMFGGWEMEGRGRYNRGSSYARRKRDSMGRYSREWRDGRMDGRYSRDDAKERMIEQMEQLMNGTQNEREREIIKRAMEQLEQA